MLFANDNGGAGKIITCEYGGSITENLRIDYGEVEGRVFDSDIFSERVET